MQFAAERSWSRCPEGLRSGSPVPRGLALQSQRFTVHPPCGSPPHFLPLSQLFSVFKTLKKDYSKEILPQQDYLVGCIELSVLNKTGAQRVVTP